MLRDLSLEELKELVDLENLKKQIKDEEEEGKKLKIQGENLRKQLQEAREKLEEMEQYTLRPMGPSDTDNELYAQTISPSTKRDENDYDDTGKTKLHSAVLYLQPVNIIEKHLEHDQLKIKPKKNLIHFPRTKHDETVLHLAAKVNHHTFITFLINENRWLNQGKSCGTALMTHKDHNGRTAVHVAIANGHWEASYLLTRKSKNLPSDCLNIKDNNGQLPIHIAAAKGNIRIFNLLLEISSKNSKGNHTYLYGINVKDNKGRTPLDIATQKKHTAIVNRLNKYHDLAINDQKRKHPEITPDDETNTLSTSKYSLFPPANIDHPETNIIQNNINKEIFLNQHKSV